MGVTKCCEVQLDLLDFWRRGLMSAAAARHIAVVTRGCNPQDAFIAALMQDIGMVAMHTALGQTYADVLAGADGNHRVLPRRERTRLGITHAEVGALLGLGILTAFSWPLILRSLGVYDSTRRKSPGAVVSQLMVAGPVSAVVLSAAVFLSGARIAVHVPLACAMGQLLLSGLLRLAVYTVGCGE